MQDSDCRLSISGWLIEGAKRVIRRYAGLKRYEIRVDDRHWAYLEGGHGEVIFLVHGYGMEKDGWDLFANSLTPSYRVIIPDLPGFGETATIESETYGVPEQVRRLDRFVNALGVSAFHLAGISMGGAIAAYYAGEHPRKVKSLLLMAPAGVASRLPSAAWRTYREEGKAILLYRSVEEFDRLLDAIFYKKPFLPRSVKKVFAQRGSLNFELREKILRDLERAGIEILENRLSRVVAPTLLFWGEKDQILHVSGAEKFKREMANCRSLILRQCGHVVFFDQREAVETAYRAFLQSRSQG